MGRAGAGRPLPITNRRLAAPSPHNPTQTLLFALQAFLTKLLTIDVPALMILPRRLEINIPPAVTAVAEAAVGRDAVMRAVASAVLQADALEHALLAALPLGPQGAAGGVSLPDLFSGELEVGYPASTAGGYWLCSNACSQCQIWPPDGQPKLNQMPLLCPAGDAARGPGPAGVGLPLAEQPLLLHHPWLPGGAGASRGCFFRPASAPGCHALSWLCWPSSAAPCLVLPLFLPAASPAPGCPAPYAAPSPPVTLLLSCSPCPPPWPACSRGGMPTPATRVATGRLCGTRTTSSWWRTRQHRWVIAS